MKVALLCLMVAVVSLYGGYVLGRSTLPKILVRSNDQEIISSERAKVTAATSSTSRDFDHSRGYKAEAFMSVGNEASTILESIVGRGSYHYYVYVLPEFGGFRLVVHHDNSIPDLTDEQHRQLIDRVEQRLEAETISAQKKSS